EWAAAPPFVRSAVAVRPALSRPAVDRDFLRFALHLDRIQGLDLGRLLELLEEWLRNQDLVRAGAGAEPRRGVHGVADHRILEPAFRPDVAREDLAEIDADPDAELGAPLVLPLGVQLLARAQLAECAGHGALGIILVDEGRAPERHDRVAT